MVEKYNPKAIEPKWQARWAEDDLYHAPDESERPERYFLLMYPYPSGRLHAGHWFMYAPPDARARYLRMKGYNVMFPMGFDSFGLPAENAAIKRGVPPKVWTYDNIADMRHSFTIMGASYDWDRMVITSDPEYYRWTQWLFIQFFKHGLAYREFAPVDWCPHCNTTLAREQVVGEDRLCERCGTPVIKKDLFQWKFRITNYAEELLDFSGIDWPARVRAMQTNWIGRSEGAQVEFRVPGDGGRESNFDTPQSAPDTQITVFTTRPDTLWGATFMVLAPEHPLVEVLTTPERKGEVDDYVYLTRRASEIERTAADREKTGVFIGAYAINPVNGERIPIWIADYVLMGYGTGAIMAVPAHDERDFEFAQKYGLPIVPVIRPAAGQSASWLPTSWNAPNAPVAEPGPEGAYTGPGVMINSGPFDGTPVPEGVGKVIDWLEDTGKGQRAVNYRLRDWLISRQRYWGAPIPIIYCQQCGTVPVPEDELPVVLPDQVEFLPTGESPLKLNESFWRTTCPQCGGPAERETDTMDTFVDSSWYWFRYCSPHDETQWADPAKVKIWTPVDQYAGGIEHATMHLLYARFFTKALNDMGLVDHREPFLRLFNQGLILGEDNEKMSKSRGNVVDPDHVVEQYGADVFRTFLMFIGPWEKGGPWSSASSSAIPAPSRDRPCRRVPRRSCDPIIPAWRI